MKSPSATAVQAILPVRIPSTSHRLARGVRAGRWLFATGQCGTDYENALAPEVVQAGHPCDGPSKPHREAQRLLRRGRPPKALVTGAWNATRPRWVDANTIIYAEIGRAHV